jgi:hypothetical protein
MKSTSAFPRAGAAPGRKNRSLLRIVRARGYRLLFVILRQMVERDLAAPL